MSQVKASNVLVNGCLSTQCQRLGELTPKESGGRGNKLKPLPGGNSFKAPERSKNRALAEHPDVVEAAIAELAPRKSTSPKKAKDLSPPGDKLPKQERSKNRARNTRFVCAQARSVIREALP